MLLNLNRIELFVRVAKHHNLGKAAREIHVSVSSVCQRLKCLENDFGVKLYAKKKEGIELTGPGQILVTAATDVLNQLENLRKMLNHDSQVTVESLTVGGTYNPSEKFLPSAIAAFQKTHPDVKVKFITADGASIDKLVRESEVDIAIIHSPSESSDFHKEHFAADELTFFAHPMHPLSKKKKLVLQDLSKTPLIVREGRNATHTMLQQLKCRGLTPNIALRCATPDTVKAAVRNKMGLGILFYHLIEDDIKRNDLKTLKFPGLPKLVGNSYIVYTKNKPLSCTANDFLTLLRSMKTHPQNGVSSSESNEDSPVL